MILNEYKQSYYSTFNLHPFLNYGWFTGRHLNCFKIRDKGNTRESVGKLRSWEHETIRFNF
jgi:hypothetical protein